MLQIGNIFCIAKHSWCFCFLKPCVCETGQFCRYERASYLNATPAPAADDDGSDDENSNNGNSNGNDNEHDNNQPIHKVQHLSGEN